MKSCLILAGRIDTFEDVYSYLKSNLIDKLNPDIFFHGYPNKKGLEYCKDKIIELWNPKKYSFIEYNEITRKNIHPNYGKFLNKRNETTPETWLSGIFNIKKANELKNSYEKDHNFKYDICIKSRTDAIWYDTPSNEELQLSKLENNILIPTAWDFKCVNTDSVSDVVAICNSKTMDVYSSLYDYIDYYYDEYNFFHPETLLGLHLKKHNLNRIEITKGYDPFSKKPNNSGWVVIDPNPNRKSF